MKNIIYTGSFRFPEGDAAAPRVLNNAKILRTLGFNVIFISWGGQPQKSDEDENGNFRYEGFRYINSFDRDQKQTNIFKRLYHHFFNGRNSLRIINQMIHNTDIVIGYNPSMFFTNKMLSLCKKHSITFISDITEWYDSNEFPGGKYAPPAWINELNMRITQRKVKNKILISSFLDNYYKSSNNIILPPLVDMYEKWTSNTKLNPFNGIRIIYAGTPAKKDLLETMLEGVIKIIKKGLKLQFVVLGVSKEMITHYSIYKEAISLTNDIIFCGKVPQKEVPNYYMGSDFSIIIRMPIRKNMAGFPTKFVESFIAGVPVISNNTSDLGKYLKTDRNGILLDGTSLEEVLIGLRKLFRYSKDDIRQMKINTRVDACDNFHYTEFISKFQAFINNLK